MMGHATAAKGGKQPHIPVPVPAACCPRGSLAGAAVGACVILLAASLVLPSILFGCGGARLIINVPARALQQTSIDTSHQLSAAATPAFDAIYSDYLVRHNAGLALLNRARLAKTQRTELSRMRFLVVTVCKLG